MKIIADTHVHTIMSGHAHSTLLENLSVAKQKEHKYLFVTDHSGVLSMCPDKEAYFLCLNSTLPEIYEGIRIVRGCETTIINYQGEIDFRKELAKQSEWVIASLHEYLLKPQTEEVTTDIWLKIAENPDVDVIGHCGEKLWRFDFEKCIKKFKEYNKIIEFNSASLKRGKILKNDATEIAKLCKKYELSVVLSSDAHFAPQIGNVEESVELIESVDFPKKLILNTDCDKLNEYINRRY